MTSLVNKLDTIVTHPFQPYQRRLGRQYSLSKTRKEPLEAKEAGQSARVMHCESTNRGLMIDIELTHR